jgi:hypothetical protein
MGARWGAFSLPFHCSVRQKAKTALLPSLAACHCFLFSSLFQFQKAALSGFCKRVSEESFL